KGLEQGLYHILAERAREIAGEKKLETTSFVIELRVDGTLDKGEVRVQHRWVDSSGNKTGVLAPPKPAPEQSSNYQTPPQNPFNHPQTNHIQPVPQTPNFVQN